MDIFPGITTTTDFAVLGLETAILGTGATASSLVSSGFSVQYDAARDAYVIDLPSADAGRFHSAIDDSRFWYGHLVSDTGVHFAPYVNIFKPSPTNPDLVLEHTTFGMFNNYDYYDYDISPAGFFAFGTATPASAIPTTGSATYDALVRGMTLDRGWGVDGTASLQFNFGAGTLAGSFNPFTYSSTHNASVSLGTYTFVNTVFGVGSTTFSGQLQHGSTSGLGAFNGMFTGPIAQELMARWTAPYLNPDTSQWSEMFGVWVGKKCC